MIPGCYDPAEPGPPTCRARASWRSVSFPTLPRFGGALFPSFHDKELADVCVQAWNDFMIDEWCAAAPRDVRAHERSSSCGIPTAAVTEIERLPRPWVAGDVLPRGDPQPRAAVVLHRLLGPVLVAVRRGRASRSACTSGRAAGVPFTPPEAPPSLAVAHRLRGTHDHAARRHDVRSACPGSSPTSRSSAPRAASAGCRPRSSAPTACTSAHRVWTAASTTTSCRRRSARATCGSA